MDPQLSGFALGLLFGAAKIGFLGTVGFGIGWWRAHRRLRRYQDGLPDPGRLEDRLASLEQASEYTNAKLTDLLEVQTALVRSLAAPPVQSRLPPSEVSLDEAHRSDNSSFPEANRRDFPPL